MVSLKSISKGKSQLTISCQVCTALISKKFLVTHGQSGYCGSSANDASGDDLSLGDDVLNTYKDSGIAGEAVFVEIENLPNAAPVSETTSNDQDHDPICHRSDEDVAIDSAEFPFVMSVGLTISMT